MQIETLVFFDFETTGLPTDNPSDPLLNMNRCKEMPLERTNRLERLIHSDGTSRMPRITEMSFVCIPRPLFVAATKQLDEKIPRESIFEHFRVTTNVHTRQINPQLTPLEWTEYEEARLASPKCIQLKKSDLEWKCTFGQEWPGVIQMLQICPKPACLIAHNGINFDFRLLHHEIRRTNTAANLLQAKFPDQIYFLDTLHGLLDIELEYNRQAEIKSPPKMLTGKSIVLSRPQSKRQRLSSSEEKQRIEPESTRTATAATATEVIVHSTASALCSKTELIEDEQNPHEIDEINWAPARKHRAARNRSYFCRNFDGGWRFNEHQATRALMAHGNFRLESLHKRFFSTPMASHRAQSDSEALLQICLAYGEDFVKYLDKNSSAFPACFRKV